MEFDCSLFLFLSCLKIEYEIPGEWYARLLVRMLGIALNDRKSNPSISNVSQIPIFQRIDRHECLIPARIRVLDIDIYEVVGEILSTPLTSFWIGLDNVQRGFKTGHNTLLP